MVQSRDATQLNPVNVRRVLKVCQRAGYFGVTGNISGVKGLNKVNSLFQMHIFVTTSDNYSDLFLISR